jgi:hypothetical protein
MMWNFSDLKPLAWSMSATFSWCHPSGKPTFAEDALFVDDCHRVEKEQEAFEDCAESECEEHPRVVY